MELQLLSFKEYSDIFSNSYHQYNRAAFNQLNAILRDIPVEYLGFRTKKFKLGIIGGIADGIFRSPFSAPFGGFSFLAPDVSLETIEEALLLLKEHCSGNGYSGIELTLPPLFYQHSFISKLNNCLLRSGFAEQTYDLNYSIHLTTKEEYLQSMHSSARNKLNIALAKPFTLQVCASDADREQAYEIIRINRTSKGYPLKMSFDAILQTISVLKADFFIARLDGLSVAAAMVFHVAEGIVQVVYWGDHPDYSVHRPMNFLSFSMVQYYLERGISIMDIGPSTENSVPNYGLCEFKESIGCGIYPKSSWSLRLHI